MKRTGGATLGTMVAWHMSAESLRAEGEQLPKVGESTWAIKITYKAKRTLSGPKNEPYSQYQLDKVGREWWQDNPIPAPEFNTPNPFTNPPEVPYGSHAAGGEPKIEKVNYETVFDKRVREPELPKVASNWKDPSTGKYYIVFLYDVVEYYKKK